jgi:hypothetical protein
VRLANSSPAPANAPMRAPVCTAMPLAFTGVGARAPANLGHAKKDRAIELRGVENGVQIVHSLVERRHMGGRIREAGAALVPYDHPGGLGQLFDERGDLTRGFAGEGRRC